MNDKRLVYASLHHLPQTLTNCEIVNEEGKKPIRHTTKNIIEFK